MSFRLVTNIEKDMLEPGLDWIQTASIQTVKV
jgi:hypothetical protein